jgi:hypothetical protein
MTGKLGIFGLIVASLVFVGCNRLHVIYEVSEQPVPIRAQELPLREIRNAIIDAAYSRKWRIQEIGRRQLRATYSPRKSTAVVIITYDHKYYSIAYHDSRYLQYGGGLIHRNYNRWVRNLDRDIQRRLREKAMRRSRNSLTSS